MKDGAIKHVLAVRFDLYEMLMDVRKGQKQGRAKIRIGAEGKKESYSTMGIMTSTIV